MTILTKPFGDKKPLVGGNGNDGDVIVGMAPSAPMVLDYHHHHSLDDPESDNIINVQRRSLPTLFLLLLAFFVMGLGILGGVYVYGQYAQARMQRIRFHGFCGVPYDSTSMDSKALILMNSKWREDEDTMDANFEVYRPESMMMNEYEVNDNFFREEFELVTDEDNNYSKITVPDFRDGRRGRFLHDFKSNQSAIIDKESNRCFAMPLDRDTVLPPRSLYDLVNKMWNGYYDIDTDVVRKNFRVVIPPVSDTTNLSTKIVSDCMGMKIYMMEKYISGVYKRSIDLSEKAKYAEFSGKSIVEFDIVNLPELEAYENNNSNEKLN